MRFYFTEWFNGGLVTREFKETMNKNTNEITMSSQSAEEERPD